MSIISNNLQLNSCSHELEAVVTEYEEKVQIINDQNKSRNKENIETLQTMVALLTVRDFLTFISDQGDDIHRRAQHGSE